MKVHGIDHEYDRQSYEASISVGKALTNSTRIPVYTADNSIGYKLNGDLKIGDYVFNREGKPVKVTGVYPQGELDIYEVELTDGRKLLCNSEHIWTYKSRFGNGSEKWKTATTKELMLKYRTKYYCSGRTAHSIKFVIPMNKAVQWGKIDHDIHPYVIGCMISNGCLTLPRLTFSSCDEQVVKRIATLIGACDYHKDKSDYSWYFHSKPHQKDKRDNYLRTADVFASVPELIGKYANEKYIPDSYKRGSISQRWELIRGLFDTDGTIGQSDNRFNVSYSTTSERLAYDIQEVLYSLGVSSSVLCHKRANKSNEYDVHVKIGNSDKKQFFYVSRKRYIAQRAALSDKNKTRIKKFG